MDSNLDMSDKNAWDDSLLIDSWDDAVAEYKKYHSIHKSGKRLEDVLTEEELKELREEHSDVMEEAEIVPVVENGIVDADQSIADMSSTESSGGMHVDEVKTEPEEVENLKEQQEEMILEQAEPTMLQDVPPAPAMPIPQALLASVHDENLKNIMMSWYYAGYYTGLHVGQQQQSNDSSTRKYTAEEMKFQRNEAHGAAALRSISIDAEY